MNNTNNPKYAAPPGHFLILSHNCMLSHCGTGFLFILYVSPSGHLDPSLIVKMIDDTFNVKNMLCKPKTLWGGYKSKAHAKLRGIWGNAWVCELTAQMPA